MDKKMESGKMDAVVKDYKKRRDYREKEMKIVKFGFAIVFLGDDFLKGEIVHLYGKHRSLFDKGKDPEPNDIVTFGPVAANCLRITALDWAVKSRVEEGNGNVYRLMGWDGISWKGSIEQLVIDFPYSGYGDRLSEKIEAGLQLQKFNSCEWHDCSDPRRDYLRMMASCAYRIKL
ncbi:MAG: hypothetical protein WCX69_04795 [Candidatus Paceibacterota bacterium]